MPETSSKSLMGETMKPFGSRARGKAVTVVLFAAFILLADYAGLFRGADNYFYDLLFRLRGPVGPAANITVIAIDDKTLETLGRWPIRRLHYASLLTWLREADVVAFDIIMTEPSADDAALQESIARHGKVVLPVVIDDRMHITYPVVAVPRNHTGHIYLEPDMDGVVREVYHTLLFEGSALPSLSSVILESATGKALRGMPREPQEREKGRITQLDRMDINYCGGPGTFGRISLADVIAGVYPSSFFRGRICLVGVTATGAAEILLTPFSQDRKGTPGVEVHANVLNTLLQGDAIRVVPPWIMWLFAVSLTLSSFLLFLRVSEARAVVLACILLACIGAITASLFLALHVWLAPSLFLFSAFSVYVMAYAFKFNEAVSRLDAAYMAVTPHLGRRPDHDGRELSRTGMGSLFTPGGVSRKAQILGEITDRLVFEKQLADAAVFSDVQGVLLFGPAGECVLANEFAVTLCKGNGVDTEDIHLFIKGMAEIASEKTGVETIPERLYGGDHHVTFNISFPVPGKKHFKIDGSPLTIQGKRYPLFVFSDITIVKELEILKSHVVSLVSHEIKTPLMSIEGFSELLYDALEGEQKQRAAVVWKESGRLIRFLNTFLDISRIEEGRQPIRLAPVMLSEVAREVARELTDFSRERGVALRTEGPQETGALVIDRDLTKQCLMNLVENAIKFSGPGKDVMIRIVEEADHIRADIIDSGIGIRQNETGLIFDKFYRVQSGDTRSIQGSGLGLAFVKEAVAAQGATVSVESRYGEGSTFSILFPKKDGEGKR